MIRLIVKCLKSDKIKIYILLILFSIFVINIVSSLTNFIENNLEKEILNKVENRIVYASSTDDIDRYDEIESFNHVENVYYNIEPILANCNNINYYIKHFTPTIKLKRIIGNVKRIKENEVIVPKSFVNKYGMEINNCLKKRISIKIGDTKFYFKISGVYNDDEQNQYIFFSSKSLINKFINNKTDYIILVDSYDNIPIVAEYLNNMEYNIQYIDNTAKNELLIYTDIYKIFIEFSKLCYIFLIIIIFILLVLNISEKKYNIALMKTLGYSNNFIASIIIIIFTLLLLFSLLISGILIKVIDLLLRIILNLKEFYNLSLIMKNGIVIFIILLWSIIIIIIQVKKINIINLLKNKNN